MSLRLFKADILFLQRFLKASGQYSGKLDGVWAERTDDAVASFERASRDLAAEFGRLDARSEASIATLQLDAQRAARVFMSKLAGVPIGVRIISGTRSYAAQNELFRRGRYGNPGPRVTNARGGSSMHNFGIAWDIGVFERGRYVTRAGPYEEVARISASAELTWGGRWTPLKDRPHFELATARPVTEVRRRFERGQHYA